MKWLSLIIWIAACFGVAALGGQWTASEIPTWYANLHRPSFAPPNWVFGPVWTALYLAMALAAWRITGAPRSAQRRLAMILFIAQLSLNLLWTWFFFHQHQIGWAVVDIGLLWIAIAACIWAFWRISRIASLLMIPYLAWVSFAAALNISFWQLNA